MKLKGGQCLCCDIALARDIRAATIKLAMQGQLHQPAWEKHDGEQLGPTLVYNFVRSQVVCGEDHRLSCQGMALDLSRCHNGIQFEQR